MIEPRGRQGGLRVFHGVALVAVFIVAAVVIWVVFSFVVGIIVKIIEIALIAAVVAFAIHLISRRGRKRHL